MGLEIVHHRPFHWIRLSLQDRDLDAFYQLSKAKQQKRRSWKSGSGWVFFTSVSSRLVKNTPALLPVQCETKQEQHL